MPPKVTVSRQQVLDAAFEVVRCHGMPALSARRVARQLGCSTQPVYRAYRSMDELRQDVLERAGEVAMTYLLSAPCEGRPFLQVGLGSLRFAKEEPQLYRAVTLLGPIPQSLQQGKPPPDFVLERMKAEPVLASMSSEQLNRIHALMWFFSQGVATLFESEMEGDPMELATKYLMLAGQAVITFELNRSNS